MLPTGISAGGIMVRDNRSEDSINIIPPKIEKGIKRRLSEPMRSLTMCGTTNPMNPITPLSLTIKATIRVQIKSMIFFVRSTFTPSVFAVCVSISKALRSLA